MSIWSLVADTWRSTPAPFKTIIVAVCGILVGAWLTSRAQAKRRVIDELKAVRAAHALCFTIVNKALAIKRQHLRRMKADHDAALKAYKDHRGGTFHLVLDLQALSQVTFANESLSRIVLERTSLGAKGLAAAVTLSDSTNDLKYSIDFRNNLIAQFQKDPPSLQEDKIALYIGVRNSADVIDERFKANIAALADQVDDCIFFGMLLADELLEYGNALRRKNCWKYHLGLPKMLPTDWTMAKEARLIPAESKFAAWTKKFKKPPTRWARFRMWFKGAK